MADVAPGLQRLATAMSEAQGRLDRVDTAAVMDQAGGPITDLRDQLADSTSAVETAAAVAQWVPGMLGAEGDRSWLVMLQNPAEARGSGGFVGGYVVLRARDGDIIVERTGTSSELAASPIDSSVAPEDAQLMWGDILQRWGAFNVSPHFPMTAALAAAGMDELGTPVDGVIGVDPAAVASMLSVTGPVTFGDWTIDADNVEQFFTVDIYEQIPDSRERDDVSMALVQQVLERLLTGSWDPVQLGEALAEPVEQDRVLVWSADADEQPWLETGPVGGVLPDSPGSVVAVAFNNAGENKTDAFVATSVDYRPGRCPTAAQQSSTLAVTLRNDAPKGLPADSVYGKKGDPEAKPGDTRMLVHVYAPLGAQFVSSTLDGEDVPLYLGSERNRPVWWTYVDLPRGAERTLDIAFTEPTVLGVQPAVIPQPMVIDEVVSVTPDPAC
jgi:hypothetical protein